MLLRVPLLLIALAIGVTATGPKTTNVNTNYNNNYNSNLDLLFIKLVTYLTEVLGLLQKSGHLPKGESDSSLGLPELPQFPTVPSLFLDPSFPHAKPEENEDDDGDLSELAGFKGDLASIFPSAESVNININKNKNINFNILYDYLINYLVAYQQSKVTDYEKPSRPQQRLENKRLPVHISTDVPKQVDDTPEVKEAKRVFQKAYDEARARVTQALKKHD